LHPPLRYALAAKTRSVKGAWHTLSGLICFPPKIGSTSFLATKHPMDVSSLAGQVMSQPVSIPLQDGLGFFHHLAAYLPLHALRLVRPKGEGMRLSRSTYLTPNTSGPLFLPAGVLPVSDVLQSFRTTRLPFWFKPHSSFGLSIFTTVTSVHFR
jgi:hypothetical protein